MKIGIDLGTTFSACACISNNKPTILLNSEGESTTPSVVLFEDDASITVGSVAKERQIIEPFKTVSAFKNYIGTDKKYTFYDKQYTPEEISSFVLRKIVNDAEKNSGEKVEGVVVTKPAYFTDAQCKATEDACRIAGINLIALINEPTAAALCYVNSREAENENIMVYDLGGGTFDVSIVNFSKGQSTVVATGGIRKLGGHFFDQLIVNYVTDYIEENYDIDLYDDEYLDVLQELVLKAEKCKIALSSSNQSTIFMRIGSEKIQIKLTRDVFEKMIERFYYRTESTIKIVLNDANMTFDEIDKIILIGGSSRIPFIRRKIKELSGIEPLSDINADEAVALGAAIRANDGNMVISDVCSHSVGIVILNEQAQKVNAVVIRRNTNLPCCVKKGFVIPSRNINTLVLEITEGEGIDVEYVNVFSTIEIDLPENVEAGTKVELDFRLDENQILNISALIKTVPEIRKTVNIDRLFNLTKDEVEIRRSNLALKVIN